jgi:hypothetical protein
MWKSLNHRHILPFYGLNPFDMYPFYGMVSPWMKNGNILYYTSDMSISVREIDEMVLIRWQILVFNF